MKRRHPVIEAFTEEVPTPRWVLWGLWLVIILNALDLLLEAIV